MSFVEPTDDESEGHEEEPEPLSDYGQRFVQNAPEEERSYAEKYVRQWDQGYAKAKSQWENEINEYRQLGDVQELNAGKQLYSMLVNQPERIAEYLAARGIYNAPPVEESKGEEDPYDSRFKTVEQRLEQMQAAQYEQYQAQSQKQQIEEFKAQLAEAKRVHGDFDEQTVIAHIAAGGANSIDDAVKQYRALEQKILQSKGRGTAPNLLGSNGAPPRGAKKPDFGKASNQEITNYIAESLKGDA